ncbi:uncharacterized protein WM294_005871 [Sarcoramphus papa]
MKMLKQIFYFEHMNNPAPIFEAQDLLDLRISWKTPMRKHREQQGICQRQAWRHSHRKGNALLLHGKPSPPPQFFSGLFEELSEQTLHRAGVMPGSAVSQDF